MGVLTDLYRAEGVTDLPTSVKAKFAQALNAEAKGETEKAEELLNQAVANEERLVAINAN